MSENVGLRMMGKDPDGNAKAVRTDSEGYLDVKTISSITLADESYSENIIEPNESFTILPEGTYNFNYFLISARFHTGGKIGIRFRFRSGQNHDSNTIDIDEFEASSFLRAHEKILNTPNVQVEIVNQDSSNIDLRNFTIIGVIGYSSRKIVDQLKELNTETQGIKARLDEEFNAKVISSIERIDENLSIDAGSSKVFEVDLTDFSYYSLYIDAGANSDIRVFDVPRGQWNDLIRSNGQRRFINSWKGERHLLTPKLKRVHKNHRVWVFNDSEATRALNIEIYKYA